MKPLSERKDLIRAALDHDEIRELKLAVQERLNELSKLEKKAKGYGLNAHEFRERKRILEGTDTEPGLLHLLELEPATEDAEELDIFHEAPGQGEGATPASAECAHENTRTEPGLAGTPITVCTDCGSLLPRQLPSIAGSAEEDEADETVQEADYEIVDEEESGEPEPKPSAIPDPREFEGVELETEDVTPAWAKGGEDETGGAGEEDSATEPEPDRPLLAHELPGIPFEGTLHKAGTTTPKLLKLAEAGQLMSIHGIGVGGEERITDYLIEKGYIDAPATAEEGGGGERRP